MVLTLTKMKSKNHMVRIPESLYRRLLKEQKAYPDETRPPVAGMIRSALMWYLDPFSPDSIPRSIGRAEKPKKQPKDQVICQNKSKSQGRKPLQ